jgi:hypothetical protein
LGRLATNTRTGTNGWRFLRMPQGNGFRATISMRRFGGMTRGERFAASTQQVSPLPIPLPLQNEVVDERRLLTVPWVSLFQWVLNIGTRTYLEGTHAERVSPTDPKYDPANFRPGTWFYETDRKILYQVRIVGSDPVWVYVAGTMRDILSNIPTDLGPNVTHPTVDTGFLFNATDYLHTWRWTGTTWEYAPGDRASGEIAWFTADPGTGWKLCNGTATTRTTATAGTAAFTTPNLIGCYAKGGSVYTGGVVAASIGSLSGVTLDPAGDHSHTINTFLTDGNGTGVAVQAYASGTPANVAALAHQHYVSSGPSTTTNGVHTHTVSGGSVTGGEPTHVDLLPYYRR